MISNSNCLFKKRMLVLLLRLSVSSYLLAWVGIEPGIFPACALAQNTAEGGSQPPLTPAPNEQNPPLTPAPNEQNPPLTPTPNEQNPPLTPTPNEQNPPLTAPQHIESAPEEEGDELGSKDPKEKITKLRILRQKKCRILIETSDVKLNLLRAGTVITIHLSSISIPVRISKASSGKIQASLRKSNCNLQLEGQSATYSLGAQLESQEPRIRSSVSENQQRNSGDELSRHRTFRRTPSGPQFILGLENQTLGKSAQSFDYYSLELTYEWFDSPQRGLRRSREGGAYGVGLSLTGFKNVETLAVNRSSFGFDFIYGTIPMRAGYRWVWGPVGMTIAPTFNFVLFLKLGSSFSFLPGLFGHRFGMDLQLDYALGDEVLIVGKGNYYLFGLGSGTSELSIFRTLFGLWWLL
ncbi:MAG: hypothetical protein FJY29_00665 [Betaproteobacteria bacterium]|nr:hypothetical protein [Betaproteobacteria bacterium]